MKKLAIAVLCSSLFFLSCSSTTLYHDYYNTDDLTSYETFDWLPRRHAVIIAVEGGLPDKDLVEDALKETVNEQLISRGFSHSADNPDLLISYLVDAEVVNNDVSQKVGVTVQQDSMGDIFLDFKDAKTRASLWRAAAFDIEVKNATPEKIKTIIAETVVQILKKFPSELTR